MAQKYQQIEINKEEFKNLVTKKINNVHEFFWKQTTTPISNPTIQHNEL